MRIAVLRCLVLCGFGFSFLVTAAPANADAFGFPNPGYYADSRDHWYCYSSVPSADQFYIAEAMGYLDDATVLYDQFAGACGGSTDVVWVPGDLEGTTRGLTVCAVWASQSLHVCNQFWVISDTARGYQSTLDCAVPDADNFYANFRKTIRHELGHSTGLSHGAQAMTYCAVPPGDDAMVSGWVPTHLMYVAYNGHHVAHIGATY